MNPLAVLPIEQLVDRLPSLPAGPLVVDCSGVGRLPAQTLAMLAVSGRSIQLNDACSAIRHAAAVLRSPVLLLQPSHHGPELPFSLAIEADGTVLITPEAQAPQHPRLNDGPGHAWIQGIAGQRYAADLSAIAHINSVLVAWLLQIAQQVRPARMEIRRASPQVATQFRQLRLDHLMPLV